MKIHISHKGFKCGYCGKKRKGAYKIIDGAKSCETCNRAYDFTPPPIPPVICPVCKGEGWIK